MILLRVISASTLLAQFPVCMCVDTSRGATLGVLNLTLLQRPFWIPLLNVQFVLVLISIIAWILIIRFKIFELYFILWPEFPTDGSGLCRFSDVNKAFICKLGWKILHEPDNLWVHIVQAKYLQKEDFLFVPIRCQDSLVLKNILKTASAAAEIYLVDSR